jgi:hypothetical protein
LAAHQPRRRPVPATGGTLFTPGATRLRRIVERRSAAPLVFLHQLPRWVLPIALAALLIAGIAVRGVGGGVALAVLAALLGWLGYLSWPAQAAAARLQRAAVVAALLVAAIYQGTR